MTEESNLGGAEYVVLIIGMGAVFQKLFMPFFEKLQTDLSILLDKLNIILINYWLFLAIILIILPLTFYLQYKINLKSFNKRVEKEEQQRIEREIWAKERRKKELEETIHQAKLKKDYDLEKKLTREQEREESARNDNEELDEDYYETLEEDEPEETEDDKIEQDYQDRKKHRININVDFDKIFYKKKELNKHEVKYLIKKGYHKYKYKSIVTGKNENYILKPRHNESLKHMVMIYDIKEYLDGLEINCEIYTTRMPDVVIYLSKKKIAFEVETGTVMTNMKKFREKINLLNTKYGKNWYFIVTDRKLIKKYKKFGKVIDPRFIKFNLNKIIKTA